MVCFKKKFHLHSMNSVVIVLCVCLHQHWPQEDNGVKLIDPMGEMVTPMWEGYATRVANAEQGDLVAALKEVIEKEDINMSQEANVFVGRDTRYHPGEETHQWRQNGSFVTRPLT